MNYLPIKERKEKKRRYIDKAKLINMQLPFGNWEEDYIYIYMS